MCFIVRKFLISCTLLFAAFSLSAQDNTSLEELRAENFKLRIQIRELQEKLDKSKRTDLNMGARREPTVSTGSFFSLVDAWDELEGCEDGLDLGSDGLVAYEKVDTILFHPYDAAVQKYVDIYTVMKRDNMKRILQRYDRYLPMFRRTFRKYGVPVEFSLLAVVESAMNVNAVSKVGAAGMWQFMPDAARDYGLDLSPVNDERFNPEKATDAAARYLRDNRKRFGSWALSIMSYNCGPGNVQKAMKACNGKVTYEQLYRYLPRETRDYLPALVAAMYVNSNRVLLIN